MGTEPYLTFTPKPKHGAKRHFEWDDREGDLRRILPTWLTKAMNTTMLNAAIKLIDSVPNQEPRTIPAERGRAKKTFPTLKFTFSIRHPARVGMRPDFVNTVRDDGVIPPGEMPDRPDATHVGVCPPSPHGFR
ncbi:hypothetical protein TNIN_465931 [Trichonephila inaurata madagascariensis]|uniref:Uncharacterized protein n=1 Tax=Trichonephila inaurata madagascariensis TaxID=2747483 RepID=A0A8X6WYZ3_9ARAC|nr:hypothetical protein TNIN_465931 [Trichonephila inaurata madagascariensis]